MSDDAWIDDVIQQTRSVASVPLHPLHVSHKTAKTVKTVKTLEVVVEDEDNDASDDDDDTPPTMEDVLHQFAPDEGTFDIWSSALEDYVMRTQTDELFTGDHTKYLDIKNPDKPILRKGGMLVRFDDDLSNVTLRMGSWIWTVKAQHTIFFQKPGKQARIMSMLHEFAVQNDAN